MKRLCLLLLFVPLLVRPIGVFGQGAFVPPQMALRTVNGATMPIANATITVCGPNAAGIPCSPALAGTIFKDAALTQPLTNPFTADAQGNYQFAALSNTYTVTVTAAGFAGNSYQVSIGAGSASTFASYGSDATTFAGANPCLQIQSAIYTGANPIVNATKFTTLAGCSVNPFQAPSQSSPVNFSGLPVGGLLLLSKSVVFSTDVPWFWPNKWSVDGVGGYGTDKTVIRPSDLFKANRVVIANTGGASGCSASGGATVTISGTTITTPANLLGMQILCSSNASATAIPTPKNAQIGGIITAVSGTGPYTLTLSGAGAAGTVTNTGYTINPVIMGWQPNSQVFGSALDKITSSCTTPTTGNVIGCVAFWDSTSNEGGILSNFTFLNYDYVGLEVYTAQSQNWGPWTALTFNSSTSGNNNTIAIELGGTGWNANGGGGTGLCAPGNACALGGSRGLNGVTITGSGTGAGDGGIGIDINGANIQVLNPHYESLKIGTLIGDSAPAQNIKVSNATGCTNASCAITSTVDISASYASGSAPAPTQNILIETAARNFAGTWDMRDFINLLGITADPTVGTYAIGSAGAAGTPVYHTAQQPSCITTAGVVDTDGSHCAPGSQFQIVTKVAGTYYADSFNNNGTSDVCVQFNNAMKWIAVAKGITSGAIIDSTNFNRNSGYPCATDPFAGTLGTTIPASGKLKLGLAKFFLTVPWHVPANWILEGLGGNGLGAAGASGTLLAPNINNTANANYANDTLSACTVTTTAGSYTVTASAGCFSSGLVRHYLMACAALPCTNQATMVGGLISVFTDTTHVNLDVPAQSSLAGAAVVVTQPLIVNAGIIRDVGIDGNSYGTGGGNGNGGMVGIDQTAGAAGGSFLENVTVAHVNAIGIDASGLNNQKLSRIAVAGNAIASSVFACVVAPQGINVDGLVCQSGTSPNPTLSYGVMAGGTGFTMDNLTFQNVATGVELAVNPSFSTNNITMRNLLSGSGSTGVTTLLDLAGVSSGSNGPNFQANVYGMTCPASGCTNIVNDHFNSFVLTDTVLGKYELSRTDGTGVHGVATDSISTGVPKLQFGPFKLPAANQIFASRTTALGSTTVATNGTAASMWRVSAAVACDLASAAATVTPTIGWTDTSNTAQTQAGAAAACTTLGASSFQILTVILNVKASTAITISTAIANTPTYDVRVTAEQLTQN